MFFSIFRLRKSALALFIGLACCLFILISGFVSACRDLDKNADTFDERCDIAALYGYDISAAVEESAYIDFSLTSDEIFQDYNSLQMLCGFDLSDYKDKTVIRHSYIIDGGKAEVGLLTYNGRLIGGDVFLFERGEYLSLNFKNGEENGNTQN